MAFLGWFFGESKKKSAPKKKRKTRKKRKTTKRKGTGCGNLFL